MIPIRDDNPSRHTPVATYAIIVLNVLAWVFIQRLGTEPGLMLSVCKWGLTPGELLGKYPIGHHFTIGTDSFTTAAPNWFTVLTSMFMHGGWLHLIGNMWFLAIFGDNVEDVMGPVRFMIFYLLCGIAAATAQIASAPAMLVPMVGASGAIGGVMGAYIVMFPRAPVHMLVFFGFFFFRIVIPAFLMLGYWFLLQLLEGMVSFGQAGGGVAFWAHIGGFAAGMVLVFIFCRKDRVKECRLRRGTVSRVARYRV